MNGWKVMTTAMKPTYNTNDITEKLMAAQPVKKFPKVHQRAHNGTGPHPEPDESCPQP
jgi:hypothetical protein